MNSSRHWLSGLATIILLALAVVCWRQWNEIISLQARIESDHSDTQQLRTEYQESQKRLIAEIVARQKAEAQLRISATKAGKTPANVSGSESDPADWVSDASRINRRLRHDPEYAPYLYKQERRNLLREYGSLVLSLDLPSDKLERLKTLLVDRTITINDAADASREAGLHTKDMTAVMRSSISSIDGEIRALLGESAYADFSMNQTAIAVYQTQANNIAVDMLDAGLQITDGQKQKLTSLLFETLGKPNASGSVDPEAADARLLSQAAHFLSPEQLNVLRSFRASEAARIQIFDRIRDNASGAPATKG